MMFLKCKVMVIIAALNLTVCGTLDGVRCFLFVALHPCQDK
ncbi:hypothetical protein XF_0645 [Xylella fastidiosa 9a5c]|uniref:Uncharacterized protein n=1 Tax=Xylella fastidiosa (strain 9a5c) TaxID=160492 RepID=Q9PFL2_XYLFA|nr:hypothetical protein XF_0645 [Xylella fastidiosa 9a5c]